MLRTVAATAAVIVASTLGACSTTTPEDDLLEAVHSTSVTGLEDNNVVAAAATACGLGGLGPVGFIGNLTEYGLTDAEGSELLPAFQQYCRQAYPNGAQAAPAPAPAPSPTPTVTVTQTVPAASPTAASEWEIYQNLESLKVTDPQLVTSTFGNTVRPQLKSPLYQALTNEQLVYAGEKFCDGIDTGVAGGLSEQAATQLAVDTLGQSAESMSSAESFDIGAIAGAAPGILCREYNEEMTRVNVG